MNFFPENIMKDKLNSFIHLNENDILSKFNSKDLRHLFFLLEDYLISNILIILKDGIDGKEKV